MIACNAASISSLRDAILELEEQIIVKIEFQSTKYASYWSSFQTEQEQLLPGIKQENSQAVYELYETSLVFPPASSSDFSKSTIRLLQARYTVSDTQMID